MGGYNPKKERISYFLSHVSKEIDKCMVNYDNIIILEDFNVISSEDIMKDFCEMYNLHNLVTEPTCFKNANNPSSIDVILTNRKRCFHDSVTIETGLSDHHKMLLTVLKTYFKKKDPKIINYRSYKNFNENLFRDEVKNNLHNFNEANMNYDEFEEIFMHVLNKHTTMKKKYKGE